MKIYILSLLLLSVFNAVAMNEPEVDLEFESQRIISLLSPFTGKTRTGMIESINKSFAKNNRGVFFDERSNKLIQTGKISKTMTNFVEGQDEKGEYFEFGDDLILGRRLKYYKTDFTRFAQKNKDLGLLCRDQDILIVGCGHVGSDKAYTVSKNIVKYKNPLGNVLYSGPHQHENCITCDINSDLQPDINDDFAKDDFLEKNKKYIGHFKNIIFEQMTREFSSNPIVLKNALGLLKNGGKLWITTGSHEILKQIKRIPQFANVECKQLFVDYLSLLANEAITAIKDESIRKCSTCGGNNNLKSCSKCHKVFYCNRECQVKDWPEHKKTCKKDN